MKKYFILLPILIVCLWSFGKSIQQSDTQQISNNDTQTIVQQIPEEPLNSKEEKLDPPPTPISVVTPPLPAKPPTSTPNPKPLPPPPSPQPTPPSPPAAIPGCSSGGFNQQFLCLLNEYRKSKNLNELVYEDALNETAKDHSTWMNSNSTLSHTGEDGSKFYERCIAHSTTCDAENVAMGYTTPQKLFDGWKKSSGHNANMLGSHTKMGLSLVGKYATQIFK